MAQLHIVQRGLEGTNQFRAGLWQRACRCLGPFRLRFEALLTPLLLAKPGKDLLCIDKHAAPF